MERPPFLFEFLLGKSRLPIGDLVFSGLYARGSIVERKGGRVVNRKLKVQLSLNLVCIMIVFDDDI